MDNDRLTKKIFKYDYNLKLPYLWCHTVENLLTSFNMNCVFENPDQCDLLIIKNKVTESFQIEWKTQKINGSFVFINFLKHNLTQSYTLPPT